MDFGEYIRIDRRPRKRPSAGKRWWWYSLMIAHQ
jgi:hypothetical protein